MNPGDRVTLWCKDMGYGSRGEPRGWFVTERRGTLRAHEGPNGPPSGLVFVPDGPPRPSMEEGYPLGWWAFETREEACRSAAEGALSSQVRAMEEAERMLAIARAQIVEERALRFAFEARPLPPGEP